MLRRLRWRLTGLYTIAGLLLILLMGSGTYGLLHYYFRVTTDEALQHRMAHDIAELGLPLSAELLAADQDWYAGHGKAGSPTQVITTTATLTATLWANYQPFAKIKNGEELEEFYDGEMAAMFVLPLTAAGEVVFDPNPVIWRYPPNQAAIAYARTHGHDLRTATLANGDRVRLLTYKLLRHDETGFLQIGRLLGDQDRVLNYLLLTLLGLGGVVMVGIGAGSWWLAKRSIRPAQQAWAQQQTFIANASHELRTPLTLLRASMEVIQSELPMTNTFGQRVLQDAVAECDHMSHLLTDLLTLARLDEGQLQLRQETIIVAELLAQVQAQLALTAAQRSIQITVTADAFTLLVDPLRLRQLILIAVDNALRYTAPGGRIELCAQQELQKARFTIRDNGEGIAPEHLPHLFERFYRSNRRAGNEKQGSGLGLSIAAGLVKAMRGEITIQSQVGQGTEVSFWLPHA